MSEQEEILQEQNPGILLSKTKEYYDEFQKIFNNLKKDRKNAPKRHYVIDDFSSADHAYAFVEEVLNKDSNLSKSQRNFIQILHNTAAIQCITKFNEEHGIQNETPERSGDNSND